MTDVRFFKLLLSSILLLGVINVNASDYRYNLYLGLGPIKIPAGTVRLYDSEVMFEDMQVIRTAMIISTNSTTDKLFLLRDTIESYNTKEGESLFFKKTINEGNRHRVETAHFSKENDRFIVDLNTWDMNTKTLKKHSTEWRSTRIFDMMSMIAYGQKIDTSDREPGSTENLPMVNGSKVVQEYMVYTGNKKIKADDGCTYDCMIISIRDYANGKEHENFKAYVTNDSKHTPIQLEVILSTGTSAKALLK